MQEKVRAKAASIKDSYLGVLSDSHGLLRPSVLRAFADVDGLIHAGDVGTPEILTRLGEIAPVFAVRGNVDQSAWANGVPKSQIVEIGDVSLYVLHSLADLDLDPVAAKIAAVITGHSHRPDIHWRDGVLYLNPGSAGPRRFDLPISIARLRIKNGKLLPELIELSP